MHIDPPLVKTLDSWPSLKKHLRMNEEWLQSFESSDLQTLGDYASTGRVVHTSILTGHEEVVSHPSRSAFLSGALETTSIAKVMHGCRLAPADTARDQFALGVLYRELSFLQTVLVESEFPARFGRKLCGMTVGFAGWLGLAAAVGDLVVLERWASLAVDVMRRGYLRDADSRGLLQWILRLWCDVRRIDYPGTNYPRYAVAEEILQNWDTQDSETLGKWLVQLCNQHTRLTGVQEFADFSNSFSHFPVEVLMLFRLREQAGLVNPQVNHPLMKFPWSRLWPIGPAVPDELLSGLYHRLESDEGLTVRGLYRQLSTS
ncbi:hypothetical protein LJR260_004381 [Variovorax paradoxus]|uniref:hypothetical protein n=1 Tax=Variovorax paradoxus TaxID=34073 RepID=UPI003ECF7927